MNTLITFYLFLTFHHFTSTVSDDSTLHSYIPQDNIAIDCGSPGSNTAILDTRTWQGDANSKFFPAQNQNSASIPVIPAKPPKDINHVPYQTARLSHFEFTYTFPVTPGQKFIRLHFYPDVYRDFDTSKAFVSVKTAHYTLLKNFSAFLTAHALKTPSVVKEFCLHVEGGKVLNLTFSPASPNSDSFAFINRIEVLSMPTNLYYSAAGINKSPSYVGVESGFYPIGNDTAMEMAYRINVGGAYIKPAGDTGMFRSWDKEDDYLTVAGPSLTVFAFEDNVNFTRIQPYTAPARLYETARTMGNTENKSLLHSYNLTWEFPVDSQFNYLVRLHFCEFQREVNFSNDRVFNIFIANVTAQIDADIIKWSGGKYIPVYKDYIVGIFGEGSDKKVNLSVALRVNPEEWRTQYLDGMLNGIEIFSN